MGKLAVNSRYSGMGHRTNPSGTDFDARSAGRSPNLMDDVSNADCRNALKPRIVEVSRHSGRDCRNPVAMEGRLDSPPCVLDTGNPCRYDGVMGFVGTTC